MNFKDYIVHLKKSDVPIFGYLVGYSVAGSAKADRTLLEKLVSGYSVKPRIPPKPNHGDLFRRGCTEAQKTRTRIPGNGPDELFNFLIRDAGNDAEEIHRVVVCETVDPNGHTLGHTEVGRLVYDKVLEKLVPKPVGCDPVVEEIHNDVGNYIKEWSGQLNHNGIRSVFSSVLDRKLNSTRWHPNGGVYFVPHFHTDGLELLEDVAHFVGPEASFQYAPLLDDEKQRSQVREAFEANSIGALENLSDRIALALTDPSTTDSDLIQLQTEYQQFKDSTDEYQALLGTQLVRLDSVLDLTSKQLVAMLSR